MNELFSCKRDIASVLSLYLGRIAQESRRELHHRRNNLRWAVRLPAAKDHILTTEKSSLKRLKQTDGSVRSQGRAATRPAPRDAESCCCFCRVWQRNSAAVVVLRWDWWVLTGRSPRGGLAAGLWHQRRVLKVQNCWILWLTTVLANSWESRLVLDVPQLMCKTSAWTAFGLYSDL